MITIFSQTCTFNLLIFFHLIREGGGGSTSLGAPICKVPTSLLSLFMSFCFFESLCVDVYIPRKTMVSIRNVHKE